MEPSFAGEGVNDFFSDAALEGRVQIDEGEGAGGGGACAGAVEAGRVGDVHDAVKQAHAAVAESVALDRAKNLGVGDAEFTPGQIFRDVGVKEHRVQGEDRRFLRNL